MAAVYGMGTFVKRNSTLKLSNKSQGPRINPYIRATKCWAFKMKELLLFQAVNSLITTIVPTSLSNLNLTTNFWNCEWERWSSGQDVHRFRSVLTRKLQELLELLFSVTITMSQKDVPPEVAQRAMTKLFTHVQLVQIQRQLVAQYKF